MNIENLLNKKNALIGISILFLFIAIPKIIFPDLDHGDEYSDADVLSSGENFVKFGFIKTRFLQMREPHLDKPENLYTHYPGLPDIINGILRMAFKTDSLRFFRGISLLFAYLGVLLWYFFIKKVTNSNLIGFFSTVFYLFNPMFIFSADSLHQLAFSDFLRSLILFVFIIMVSSSKPLKQRRFLILLWFLLFIQTWIGLDCIIYLFLFFILYRFFIKIPVKPVSLTVILALCSAPVAGFLLHVWQNAWYFGSLTLAVRDLGGAAIERMVASKDSPMALTFVNWWNNVLLRNFSLVMFYNYISLFLAGFSAYFLYQVAAPEHKQEIKNLFRLSLLLVVCGISWYIFFPAHSLAHAFVNFLSRHLVPAAALLFGLFFYVVLVFLKKNAPDDRAGKIILAVIIFTIIITGISKSELPVTAKVIRQSKSFLVFKNSLINLKMISGLKDTVGVNYFRYPFIRYYTHRHIQPVFDKASLERQEPLPKYFIFIPYNNQAAQELFGFLNQKYLPIFRCDSERFPSVFFELKQ
ncbi:MAG: hypothetical protein ABH882_02155 [Candidatus Omnitrophota bacterium]|nr:hypothetical protein [Candidatus Omnitrophota bacterium]MBU1929407.1 hypothetical protein [Candidatus Omnitrophota bacterium]MBU2034282.1 hypothetical protein [Candidatus Omnitrophota bacterium]MBU2222288.1 hypothetical protein [Candidatus Omnitrophota bacterium]MBU2258382.1 hypothetical protein [Candidatus Omnitrophota bacterium]